MEAGPVLLEPIASVKVTVPDDYTGDIMGDLNKRRGRVLGMNPLSRRHIRRLVADVPMTGIVWILHNTAFHDRWTWQLILMNLHVMSRLLQTFRKQRLQRESQQNRINLWEDKQCPPAIMNIK